MIAVIGGGLAAAKLVEGYRDAGGTDAITIFSSDPHGPYHRPPLSKRLLRGEMDAQDALVHPAEWYAEQNVDLRLGESVSSLDEVNADTIVIATGARPRELGHLHTFRTIDDSLDVHRRAEAVQTATVVGGNFIGCEVTASLTQLGVTVTQVVREDALFAVLQAEPLSQMLAETYRENGVDLRFGWKDDPPPADLMIAGIGVIPNTELAKAAGLDVQSGIVVDERFATARKGVYAIGDVAEFYDPVFGKHRRIEHWSNSAYHGTTLGRILAGEDERYDIVNAFFSEEFGRSFRYFGDAEGHDSTVLEGDFGEGKAVYRFVRNGGVVAAATMGLEGHEEDALKEEIKAGAAANR
ncbi:MAG TPA: FAD-dependent oxidoreductase [Gaiellaceae bacterium]|jgi:NADPH-dependent 2,4-dienoyl-CoA reductase/sulfur reductase-like enzyme